MGRFVAWGEGDKIVMTMRMMMMRRRRRIVSVRRRLVEAWFVPTGREISGELIDQ